ncbi:hypothetical protein [Pseudoxanthomonas sp.]|jgi:hypothetical protein|uniref:hypothetical protein n=1 Tax=Pseudoxanthomonas sp. TaxID=1871049 RepID=UPI002FE2CE1E
MSRYNEVKHLLPPRVQQALENAQQDTTRERLNGFCYQLRMHERDVRILRDKVDARVDRRRHEYAMRGLTPDHRGFVTPTMRQELELLHKLECGIGAAVEEYKVLKAKVEGHGS